MSDAVQNRIQRDHNRNAYEQLTRKIRDHNDEQKEKKQTDQDRDPE